MSDLILAALIIAIAILIGACGLGLTIFVSLKRLARDHDAGMGRIASHFSSLAETLSDDNGARGKIYPMSSIAYSLSMLKELQPPLRQLLTDLNGYVIKPLKEKAKSPAA